MGPMREYTVLGLMSGSSLDGVDAAVCRFAFQGNSPVPESWSIIAADTLPYTTAWAERLAALPSADAYELALAHAELGRYFGEQAKLFLSQSGIESIDAIASHGHTIFHYPEHQMTLQIGDGAAMAGVTGITTIDQFRSQDMSLGGQGAPIAPIADQLLFPEQDFMLNLGGIANISAKRQDGYVAFDITGANQVLNALCAELGLPYDKGGAIARSGRMIPALFEKVNALPYHHQPYPKSLGNDWVREAHIPIYQQWGAAVEDRLHTACRQIGHHTAMAVAAIIKRERVSTQRPLQLLATGGGAFNSFLMDCIQESCQALSLGLNVAPASSQLINFKEALLMALMGALRLQGLPNVLPSVTGSRRPVSGGALHLGQL
ncbi:anhydro-N-acetylmuramic acid kinase [Phaeodactylibacter luteus]|uniref:Anhydro-N-acetylmuramic acid kinase n=2 Tax=Phaeodactylibacter luteus TaxID=1564516 RepID=A0A5C6S1A2_9BACT|nr:anhydro-N-acetylmuramic acid kinase [Phaeodactylibacter luteus]